MAAITTPHEFAAALAAFSTKWGERLLTGTAQDWAAALKEAAPLAKYGRVRPDRILVGAAAKWEREHGTQRSV